LGEQQLRVCAVPFWNGNGNGRVLNRDDGQGQGRRSLWIAV
jgi:hypothetical protein